MKHWISCAIVILALSMPARASVNTPMQTVQSHVNRLLAALGDPALSAPDQAEKKKKKPSGPSPIPCLILQPCRALP